MRIILIVLAGLVAVVAVAVAALLFAIDLNDYKGEIEARLEAATGRRVSVGGDIAFVLLPEIAFSIEDVTVAGAPSGSGTPFLQLPRVLASVELLPLASLEVAIERVRLVRPTIVLESGDGQASWEIAGRNGSGGGPAVSIARVDLDDARIEWRDGPTRLAFERVDLRLDARGRDGPFDLRASFLHEGRSWRLDADIGRISRPQLAVNALLAAGEEASVKIAGAVTLAAGRSAFAGQVEAEAAHAGLALALAGAAADAGSGPPLAADASLALAGDGVTLSDLALRLGESQATGEASFAPRQGAALTLAFHRLDLDALLPLLPVGGGEERAAAPAMAVFPADLRLRARLSADAIVWRGAPVRRADLAVALADGSWRLERSAALLPGGTIVAVEGGIAMEDGRPVFRGPVRASSDNLRATLAWLGLDPEGVPRDRLRRFALTARLAASPAALTVGEIVADLDSSRLTGEARAGFGGGNDSVALTLAIDRFNLDAYLPAAEGGGAAAAPPLPAAAPVDLTLDGRIEALTWRGLALGGVTVAGSWRDGRLEIERLGADDVAGASLRLSGKLDPGEGEVALTLAGEAEDAGGLLRLAGAGAPLDGARLGAVQLEGELRGKGGRYALQQRLTSGIGTAGLDGTLADPFGAAAFDGRLEAKGASLRALAGAFHLALPGEGDSAFAMEAHVGGDAVRLDFDATAQALGADLEGSGRLEGLDAAPSFDLDVRGSHDELARLAADLGAGGSGSGLGAVSLRLSAVGDGERIDAVLAPSRLGPAALEGTLAATFDGPRPLIEARLRSGELALDPFLAALGSAAPGDGGQGGNGNGADDGTARRAGGDIRLDALGAVDGRLEIAARRLSLGALALEEAAATAVIDDGRLTVERFEGGLFGGRATATGSATAGAPQRFTATLALVDADMARMARAVEAGDGVGGRLDLDAQLVSEGRTQSAIVEALDGSGEVVLREGWLDGFDLAAIGERLEGLDDPLAIARLLTQASSGGRTAIGEARAGFEIDDGIVRSQDIAARLAGGEAQGQASIDLPRRRLDLTGSVRLTAGDDLPTIPIAVAGSFDGPEIALDTRPLEAFLVERTAAAVAGTLGGNQLEATGALLEEVAGAAGGDEDADPAAAAGAVVESLPGAEPLAEGAGALLDLLSNGAPEAEGEGGNPQLENLLDLLSGASDGGGDGP